MRDWLSACLIISVMGLFTTCTMRECDHIHEREMARIKAEETKK